MNPTESQGRLSDDFRSLEGVADGQSSLDDLPILKVFGIKSSALRVQGRGEYESVVDIVAVVLGKFQS